MCVRERVCFGLGRFRWQRWHWAMRTIIHRASAFQELHGTHGRPKQPLWGCSRSPFRESGGWGAYRVLVMICCVPVQIRKPIIARLFASFWWQQSASTQMNRLCAYLYFVRTWSLFLTPDTFRNFRELEKTVCPRKMENSLNIIFYCINNHFTKLNLLCFMQEAYRCILAVR